MFLEAKNTKLSPKINFQSAESIKEHKTANKLKQIMKSIETNSRDWTARKEGFL